MRDWLAVEAVEIDRARAAVLRHFRWQDGHGDIWRVFRDAEAFATVVRGLCAPFRHAGLTAVIGIEARGFLLGGAAAAELSVGFVAVRKAGALFPGDKVTATTEPDYRGRRVQLQVQRASVRPGDRMLLVDDWIETGSQLRAVERLVGELGADIVGCATIVNQSDLRPHALVRADELQQ